MHKNALMCIFLGAYSSLTYNRLQTGWFRWRIKDLRWWLWQDVNACDEFST